MNFGRLITAMCTPFTPHHKEIDWEQVGKLIDHLLATGSESIVISGTTAESPTLSNEEKLELFSFAKKKVAGRAKIIAGTGSNSTAQTVELTQAAEAIGVDGIMLVTPYYNKPSQEGIYQHFATVASAISLPIMLYNVPGRTSVNMQVETMARLAELDNVTAIKEASGDLNQMAHLISSVPSDVSVYSGDDGNLLPVLAIGGVGVVSVASHILGKEITDIIQSYIKGETQQAAELFRRYLPVFEGLFFTTSPVPLKYALSQMQLCHPTVRLPLVELMESEKEKVHSWLRPIQQQKVNQ